MFVSSRPSLAESPSAASDGGDVGPGAFFYSMAGGMGESVRGGTLAASRLSGAGGLYGGAFQHADEAAAAASAAAAAVDSVDAASSSMSGRRGMHGDAATASAAQPTPCACSTDALELMSELW